MVISANAKGRRSMKTKKTSMMPRGSGICGYCQRPVGVDDYTSCVEWIDGIRHIIPSHNDCIDIAYRRMEEEYWEEVEAARRAMLADNAKASREYWKKMRAFKVTQA
jgi:hypothetical protein